MQDDSSHIGQRIPHALAVGVCQEKVFNLFVANAKNEPLRKELHQPFKQGGRYYATDTHSMIFLPVEKAQLNFPEQDRPNCEGVIPKNSNCSNQIKISDIETQLIPTLIDETEELEKEVKCPECDGDGVVECNLEHEHKCIDCDGTGKFIDIIEKPTGKKIPMPNKYFRMLDVCFQYKQLRRLVDACNELGVETITKTYGTETTGNLFQCGDCWILIMPTLVSDDEITEINFYTN